MIDGRKLYEIHVTALDITDLGIGVEIVPLPKKERSVLHGHTLLYTSSYPADNTTSRGFGQGRRQTGLFGIGSPTRINPRR